MSDTSAGPYATAYMLPGVVVPLSNFTRDDACKATQADAIAGLRAFAASQAPTLSVQYR